MSDLQTNTLAATSVVAAYFNTPRIVLISQQLDAASTTPVDLTTAIDLVSDSPYVEAAPGQATAATYLFNLTRGMFENIDERDAVAALTPSGQTLAVDNTFDVFNAAAAQGIGTAVISSENLNVLAGLDIPADAMARITTDVLNGYVVIVPDQSVLLNGVPTIAWGEIDFATGEFIGVDADGGHEGALEFLALVGENLDLQIKVIKYFSPLVAFDSGAVLSVAYELNASQSEQEEAAAELEDREDGSERGLRQSHRKKRIRGQRTPVGRTYQQRHRSCQPQECYFWRHRRPT